MTKLGRNEPCSCGSGKKYKHCCIDAASKNISNLMDEFTAAVESENLMSPEKLQQILREKQIEMNSRPIDVFLGLTPSQMHNWLHSDFDSLQGVTINSPQNINQSPIMRYVDIFIQMAILNDGAIKLTEKGNLPLKIVNACSAIYDELDLKEEYSNIYFSDFKGRKESEFIALEYTHIIVEIAKIFRKQKNQLKISQKNITLYQKHGVSIFFLPLLKSAIFNYNWAYFDRFQFEGELNFLWVFMIWRLSKENDFALMVEQTIKAFPQLLNQIQDFDYEYQSKGQYISMLISIRFVSRFLVFFGFAKTKLPYIYWKDQKMQTNTYLELTPMFHETFNFSW
ncbi:YecA family protein [Thorsellia anophelis]|uniref:SEC-C motif-containing protein n=1 Tax=Thorsellia anophelis DSM 18579 TaxID=1123402 RepID=A0A1I0FM11_9GAMM|nr:SEC-C domain-containing protein [Thorsellia anophelis]SET58594.1 SEC-C motif-containing protein [Thorsellia anophelis DSM 18579]